MNTKELIDHSKNTKKQAKALLQNTRIIEILKKYGRVNIIGSYPLDIMYGPDIDILVETKNIRKSSLEALEEIAKKRLFQKIEHGDFVKFPRKDRPKGYILVLKSFVENVRWEIEVWFLEEVSRQLSEYKILKSKLNKKNRIKILEAKHLKETSKLNKHKLRSFEIYEQILGKLDT